MERMDVVTKGMGALLKTSNKPHRPRLIGHAPYIIVHLFSRCGVPGLERVRDIPHPTVIDRMHEAGRQNSVCLSFVCKHAIRQAMRERCARAQIYAVGGAIVLFVILDT